MAVFLDTSVIVAEANERDALHTNTRDILLQIKTGIFGNWICTSDYVFDEALVLAFIRTGDMKKSKELVRDILRATSLNMLHVDENIFQESVAAYLAQDGALSFTDCTTIELMKQNDIKYIATFDSGFDKIIGIKRIG